MKVVTVVILSVFLFFLLVETGLLWSRGASGEAKLEKLEADVKAAEAAHETLQSDISFYLDPSNLLKELRGRFNYRAPDEKMLIIISSTSTSTGTR